MQRSNEHVLAVLALLIGVINLCAWLFVPIFCLGPFAIVGIVLGVLGRRSSQRTLATIGIVLSGWGLLASTVVFIAQVALLLVSLIGGGGW